MNAHDEHADDPFPDVELTERLKAEKDALAREVSLQAHVMFAALNASDDGFAIWTAVRRPDGDIESFTLDFINEAGAAATGKQPAELQGRRIEDVVGTDQYVGLTELFRKAVTTQVAQRETVDVDSEAGWVGAYENRVIPFGEGRIVTSFRDISDQRLEHHRLSWLADHDGLTGIPNRRKLDEFLRDAVAAATAKRPAAFAFVDVDHFKSVNDLHGHAVGDELLVLFSQRLTNALPDGVRTCRIAGDEFAVVFPDARSRANVQEAMDYVFHAMKRPFEIGDVSLDITASAGCVLFGAGAEPFEVMRVADRAMYSMKHAGRNRFDVISIAS